MAVAVAALMVAAGCGDEEDPGLEAAEAGDCLNVPAGTVDPQWLVTDCDSEESGYKVISVIEGDVVTACDEDRLSV